MATAAQSVGQGRRANPLWPFRSPQDRIISSCETKPSGETLRTALKRAYAAGKRIGSNDVDYANWLCKSGLAQRSATVRKRLKQEYERGMSASDGKTEIAAPEASSGVQDEVLSALSNLGAKQTSAKKAVAQAVKEGLTDFDGMFRRAVEIARVRNPEFRYVHSGATLPDVFRWSKVTLGRIQRAAEKQLPTKPGVLYAVYRGGGTRPAYDDLFVQLADESGPMWEVHLESGSRLGSRRLRFGPVGPIAGRELGAVNPGSEIGAANRDYYEIGYAAGERDAAAGKRRPYRELASLAPEGPAFEELHKGYLHGNLNEHYRLHPKVGWKPLTREGNPGSGSEIGAAAQVAAERTRALAGDEIVEVSEGGSKLVISKVPHRMGQQTFRSAETGLLVRVGGHQFYDFRCGKQNRLVGDRELEHWIQLFLSTGRLR